MSVTFDPSTDFEDVCDGLEAVTLNRRGSTPNTDIAHALQRNINNREIAASDGKYKAGDVRWHLPDAEIGDDPRMGDVIVDAADNRYTILEPRHDTLENRWRCVCRNVRVVYGLDDTIAILQATYAKGTGGALEPTWHDWKTGIRACIQPMATDIGVENQAKRAVNQVSIFIAEDLAITQNHRVRGRNGTIYKVTGYNGAERIGELAEIIAEVTPWPLS